jgi:hypothetical protein
MILKGIKAIAGHDVLTFRLRESWAGGRIRAQSKRSFSLEVCGLMARREDRVSHCCRAIGGNSA